MPDAGYIKKYSFEVGKLGRLAGRSLGCHLSNPPPKGRISFTQPRKTRANLGLFSFCDR